MMQAKLVVIAQEQQAAEIREIRGDVVKVSKHRQQRFSCLATEHLLRLQAEHEAWLLLPRCIRGNMAPAAPAVARVFWGSSPCCWRQHFWWRLIADSHTWYQRDRYPVSTLQAEWGRQIRNYVFHPYKMVKDLRSGHETGNTAAVMDGDLDPFMQVGI